MLKKQVFSFLALMLLLALPAAAQEEPGTLARVYLVKVKQGMGQQYEEAYKQHMEWHRQKKDTWEWHTWQIETGNQFGQYVTRTPGHHWEDFDAHAEVDVADGADFEAKAGQFVERISSTIVNVLPDISRWPEGGAIPSFVSVIEFHLKSGHARDFQYVIKKFHDAAQKTNWSGQYAWLALVSGGEPTLTIVLPHKNWADMKEPAQSVWAMMEEAYGRQESEKLRDMVEKAIHYQRSFIARFRPDLSYQPTSR